MEGKKEQMLRLAVRASLEYPGDGEGIKRLVEEELKGWEHPILCAKAEEIPEVMERWREVRQGLMQQLYDTVKQFILESGFDIEGGKVVPLPGRIIED